MRIVVLESVEMTEQQADRLSRLGSVEHYSGLSEQECREKVKDADVVVVDWVDPSNFILDMKSPSLLALMSTGYDWISHRAKAAERGVLISNVPGYATEAVAEHILGLALCVARQTAFADREIKAGKKDKAHLRGIELSGRQIGIIGLGQIGRRVAEIATALGMRVVTYNRHPKSALPIKDVPLNDLLSTSDLVCVCCPLNDDSREMLGKERLGLLRSDAVIVATTWGVVVIDDLIPLMEKGRIRGAGLDVAVEGGSIELPDALLRLNNAVLTPHIAFNTVEAKGRQVDICISNVGSFLAGNPINTVNRLPQKRGCG